MAARANVMAGYYRRGAETAAALTPDRWLRTGDGGYRDDDGYLFLTDRIKDMIVSGGENIYPAEVEEVLSQHPGVADVAVIGVPDERRGETVKAFVVRTPGSALDAEELVAFARRDGRVQAAALRRVRPGAPAQSLREGAQARPPRALRPAAERGRGRECASRKLTSSRFASGTSVGKAWAPWGSVRSCAPPITAANRRPLSTGTSRSSSPCMTNVGAVIRPSRVPAS